jgi:RNA polymerase sigma-70 factor (ECF subfamily)
MNERATGTIDFERVVSAHGDLVYGMCRRLAVDPDDSYQEIWLKVMRALPAFDPAGPAPVRGFVATIARRHLVDQHRRQQARDRTARAAARDPVTVGLEEAVDAARDRVRLEAAIADLPPDQRHVVVQHHIHGASLEELAEEQGVALGTIKSRLHRGRARLAERLRRSP